ncbi:helix-turn-helix domain-containing protein [Isoptericola nanjingensis]|uniref:AraC family transcriptional regulator n=1 Tax=Isoptericola nanjingensis TaxID=903413 RepID=UPI003D1D82A1
MTDLPAPSCAVGPEGADGPGASAASAAAEELDRVLAGLQWRFVARSRHTLAAGEWAEHTSGDAALLLVTDGLVRVRGVGDVADLAPGDFLFLPHGPRFEVHALSTAAVQCVRVAPVGADDGAGVLPAVVLLTELPQTEPTAATMLRSLVEDYRAPRSVLGDRVVTLVASMAISAWYARGCAPARWLMQREDPGLASAVAAIHADPGREWTVDDLARVALASRSGFAARFRSATGLPPGRYLAQVRVAHARCLLTAGDLPVATIARRLGYGSDTAFGRAFRRHTGATPSEYRRDSVLRTRTPPATAATAATR